MSDQSDKDSNQPDDEWETYLNVFLDESDEDLESLTQALLRLETSPEDIDSLNEAFRLLHTHKGSAGLMGFEGISELAHQLENRFEGFRSGTHTLDAKLVTLLLGCVDFLKDFNAALRSGNEPNQDASRLMKELAEAGTGMAASDEAQSQLASELPAVDGGYRVVVEFEEGLQLADMKARLIVARLENIGEIVATIPSVDEIQSVDQLCLFSIAIQTDAPAAEIQKIANVDGVTSIQLEKQAGSDDHSNDVAPSESEIETPETKEETPEPVHASKPTVDSSEESSGKSEKAIKQDPTATGASESENDSGPPSRNSATAKVSETVRVGIDRLDKLMNLTGELVVNKARLSQLIKELVYDYRSAIARQYDDDWCNHLRSKVGDLQDILGGEGQVNGSKELLGRLKADIDSLDERFEQWEQIRRKVIQVAESADQLDRVSGNLQQSVLDTRMVPVAPLFNRFRRVIRDLADDRNKMVQLEIQGETTELDKRMIDELGDPLLHLVRNSIDHGLEPPDERAKSGKIEVGRIKLDATHRGNHVLISISDDGRGLNLEKIKQRIIERGLASESQVATLTDKQLAEYIWQPGFSTSAAVTDISGRGVGMDVVKSRITELNGIVEIESVEQQGTVFTLRLPLTLAIIRSLQVRFQDVHFSIPIADVLETIAVSSNQVQTAYGRELIELRGNIIPLVRMAKVFKWNCLHESKLDSESAVEESLRVVIITAFGQTIGLVVDELFGSSDIVIKSLADNFVPIRGLSGASILGDGNVNLMIDSSEVIKMASESSSR